jgi:hypothetical protein
MKVFPPKLIMVGLSVAIQRWTQSDIEPLYLLHLVLFMVMDEVSHDHYDLTVIVIIVRQCVDDMVEEKLVRTMRHDLRQLEHPMSNHFIYIHQKKWTTGPANYIIRCAANGRKGCERKDHMRIRGGGDWLKGSHRGAKTPDDGCQEVRARITAKRSKLRRASIAKGVGTAEEGAQGEWLRFGCYVAGWRARPR